MENTPSRPGCVSAFGVLNIIFGGLGILSLFYGLISIPMSAQMLGLGKEYITFCLLSLPIGTAISIFLIVLGIGLLKLKAWARKWSVIYAIFALFYGPLMTLVTIILMFRGKPTTPEGTIGLIVGAGAAAFGSLLGLIYPIFMIVYLRKPNIVAAFKQRITP